MIKMKDIIYHSLSGLYFYCENKKMEKWMNMNKYYIIPKENEIPGPEYFRKNK